MKIGLITDSASDITYEFANKNNIKIVPQHVIFFGEDHLEDDKFNFDDYYSNFNKEKLFKVTTSQPSPGEFLEKIEELAGENYTDIICITISSGLSGTYNSSRVASEQFKEINDKINIYTIDSKLASYGTSLLVEYALEMINSGTEIKEIISKIEMRKKKIKIYVSLPTLKYLRAGGRISFPKFVIGNFIGLKPITMLKDGKLISIATVRNSDAGLNKAYQLTTDNGMTLAKEYVIAHTHDIDLANKLESIIKSKQPSVKIRKVMIKSAISAHTGLGAVALVSLFE